MSALSPFRAILCGVFVATLMPCACGMAQTASGEERHATSRHVVIISVDGLKPEFLFRHDLKLPAMRGLMKQGTYARGVVGVTPTVTFPSHTTIISGVTPSRHGICSNAHPDNDGHLVSYARYSEIKSPTILDAVHGTGLTTAAIGWPVTVDAPVDYLITPQAPDGASPLARQISFPDSLRAVDDDARSIWASLIIKRYNPNLMLLHFNDLDRMEHKYGPDSDEAAQTAQRIDARIDAVIVMEKALNPDATIIVVSDHGFAPLRHDVALSVPLREALDANGTSEAGSDKRAGRRFLVWSTDGSAYVLVPDARDRPFIQTELQRLKNRDDMGIDRILSETELAQAGGCPDAAFMVGMKLGWGVSGAVDGPAVRDIAHGGTHGYLPDQPSMRSTFIMTGPDIAHDHDIGIIDMRQIAPTILHILGVAPEPGMESALGVSGHVRAARSSADAR